MLMLVAPENNSDPTLHSASDRVSVQVRPAPPPASYPSATSPTPKPEPVSPPPPKRRSFKKLIMGILLLLVFAGAVTCAYFFGKSHQKIVIQAPPTQPLNLPPQAVVTADCVVGRGKQYILPTDIPQGPIYDVLNGKVIAIEYNLNIAQITSNPDSLSSTILDLTRKYPVDHFSLVPEAAKAGETSQNVHLIMFIVSKNEAATIKCG